MSGIQTLLSVKVMQQTFQDFPRPISQMYLKIEALGRPLINPSKSGASSLSNSVIRPVNHERRANLGRLEV